LIKRRSEKDFKKLEKLGLPLFLFFSSDVRGEKEGFI
jgi:hypothetical protein